MAQAINNAAEKYKHLQMVEIVPSGPFGNDISVNTKRVIDITHIYGEIMHTGPTHLLLDRTSNLLRIGNANISDLTYTAASEYCEPHDYVFNCSVHISTLNERYWFVVLFMPANATIHDIMKVVETEPQVKAYLEENKKQAIKAKLNEVLNGIEENLPLQRIRIETNLDELIDYAEWNNDFNFTYNDLPELMDAPLPTDAHK